MGRIGPYLFAEVLIIAYLAVLMYRISTGVSVGGIPLFTALAIVIPLAYWYLEKRGREN
ncbi:MAG: hypothetical protein ACW99U_07200 [Candidatus Thorarchaeota archaeon]|jgi:hypothetical protein